MFLLKIISFFLNFFFFYVYECMYLVSYFLNIICLDIKIKINFNF
jgi:hypothetical protein